MQCKQKAEKHLHFGVCPPTALGPFFCFVHKASKLEGKRSRSREVSVFLTDSDKAILNIVLAKPIDIRHMSKSR